MQDIQTLLLGGGQRYLDKEYYIWKEWQKNLNTQYSWFVRKYLGSDPELDEDFELENRTSSQRAAKRILALGTILIGLIGATVAANISLGDGRLEYGQGIYRIKACDQWVGVGLYPTAATYGGKSRIQTMELVGLDPRMCRNVVFNIKLFKNTDLNTPLAIFTGTTGTDTTTALTTVGDVNQVTVYDSATVTYPTQSYITYASKALTLINKAGVNVGYDDTYHRISYVAATGVYRIYFYQPLCLMEDVDKVTIESSSLS